MQVTGIVDVGASASLSEVEECDVAIDFSYPGNLDSLLREVARYELAPDAGQWLLATDSVDYVKDALEKYPDIEIRYWTGSPYFELFYKKTSKGASILEIAKYYNIQKDK